MAHWRSMTSPSFFSSLGSAISILVQVHATDFRNILSGGWGQTFVF